MAMNAKASDVLINPILHKSGPQMVGLGCVDCWTMYLPVLLANLSGGEVFSKLVFAAEWARESVQS